jgi:uncharacterized membrane protein/glutaredoxin
LITVTLYNKPKCDACDQVEAHLNDLQDVFPHHLVKIDVENDEALADRYRDQVPVVLIGPYALHKTISRQDLAASLGAASDRQSYLEKTDEKYQEKLARGHKITGTDRFSYWLSNRYLLIVNLLVFIYVGLPFAAPTFMRAGLDFPARALYTIYSPMCHQLAFRSWFLFGEQPYYPRDLAGIPNVITYNELANQEEVDVWEARQFIGNDTVGYKVALCQRDVAIYGGIFLFGLIFGLTGRRLKSIPWYLWVLFGIVPIGLDGFSQLPSMMGAALPDWLPFRESTPLFRTITGAMFGISTAWYLFPFLEESMREVRRIVTRKMAVVRATDNTESVNT